MGDVLVVSNGSIQVACGECKKKNAIPVGKVDASPVCGACGASLSAPDRPIELDDASFRDVIAQSPVPVLVDFWDPAG
jgi:thioredoxin 2